jgi:hypothetical protein
MNNLLNGIRLPLLVIGAFLVFVTERYLHGHDRRMLLNIVGSSLVVLSIAVCLIRSQIAKTEGLHAERRAWIYLSFWHVCVLAAIGFYFLYRQALGDRPSPETLWQKFLLAKFVAATVCGLCAGVGLELAHKQSGLGFFADDGRVLRTGVSWLLIGMLLTSLVGFNFTAAKRDRSFDLSYLKSTEPGTSSRNMVSSLTEAMEVILFFPGDNEVLPFVDKYFRSLVRDTTNISVKLLDADLNPADAEKYKISKNGVVLLVKGEQSEKIDVKLNLRQARDVLKKLDAEFQKAFLKLNAAKKIAYFTRGHGEMTWTGEQGTGFRSIKFLDRVMRAQQYSVRTFGMTEGSGSEVPDDATLVVIAGPTGSFLKEEVEALDRFVKRGGRILLLLDVTRGELETSEFITQVKDPLMDFLAGAGITFKSEILANDASFVSIRKAPSDKWFLFTNGFSSHESVANLAKHEERVPVLLYQTGRLELGEKQESWKTFETIRSLKSTFVDVNKNYAFDAATEKRDTYIIGAAAIVDSGKKNGDVPIEGKMIVLADSTAITDGIIASGVPGNQLLISDGLRWLVDESKYNGETSSEEDVKLRHTQKEDGIIFYSTIFGVPALLLLAGFVATRRRKEGAAA